MQNRDAREAGAGDPPRRSAAWPGAAALLLVALALRLIHLDHTPVYDEFYHLLAARSWIEHHTLSIGGGTYTRAAPFTILVAWSMRWFGDDLAAARLPALAAGALLVPLVFLWVRATAGERAGWVAGLLVAVSPTLIFLSQTVRFYTLQSLCVLLGAVGVFALADGRVRGARAGWAAAGTVAVFGFALMLQITTAIAVFAVLVWAAARVLYRLPSLPARGRRVIVRIAIGIVVAGALLAWFQRGRVAGLWQTFRVPPYWEAGMVSNHRFYFYWFMDQYPTLWSLFPLAALWAAIRRPAPAVFAAVVFTVAIVVHTLAGPKEARYIAYTLPFFFIVWGIAVAELLPALTGLARGAARALVGVRAERTGAAAFLAGLFGFVLVSNPAFPLTYRMLTRTDAQWRGPAGYRGNADWPAALAVLRPLARRSDVVLTDSGVKALYYLGRYDYEINASNLRETHTRREFAVDPRTGRRVVGSAAAVRRIMACYPTGLVIAERRRWMRSPRIVPPAVVAAVQAQARPVALPRRSRLVAYEWRHAVLPGAHCGRLPGATGDGEGG